MSVFSRRPPLKPVPMQVVFTHDGTIRQKTLAHAEEETQ